MFCPTFSPPTFSPPPPSPKHTNFHISSGTNERTLEILFARLFLASLIWQSRASLVIAHRTQHRRHQRRGCGAADRERLCGVCFQASVAPAKCGEFSLLHWAHLCVSILLRPISISSLFFAVLGSGGPGGPGPPAGGAPERGPRQRKEEECGIVVGFERVR